MPGKYLHGENEVGRSFCRHSGGARRKHSNAHKRQKNLVLGRSRQPVTARE